MQAQCSISRSYKDSIGYPYLQANVTRGYLEALGEYDYYQDEAGNVYCAHRTSVIDLQTGYRIGRYECRLWDWPAVREQIVAGLAVG